MNVNRHGADDLPGRASLQAPGRAGGSAASSLSALSRNSALLLEAVSFCFCRQVRRGIGEGRRSRSQTGSHTLRKTGGRRDGPDAPPPICAVLCLVPQGTVPPGNTFLTAGPAGSIYLGPFPGVLAQRRGHPGCSSQETLPRAPTHPPGPKSAGSPPFSLHRPSLAFWG